MKAPTRAILLSGLLVAAVVWSPLHAISSEPRLLYVAILSRHGVRSPTWSRDRLNGYSAQSWPGWGVPPGFLTPHGRLLMTLMGGYYGAWFERDGLFADDRCASAKRVYIWADTDQRTIETGRALAESIVRGCAIQVHSRAKGDNDPLFDPISAGAVRLDATTAAREIRSRIAPGLADRYRDAFAALDKVLDGNHGAAREGPFAHPVAPTAAARGRGISLSEPWSAASSLAEVLLLEYANGFPDREIGWGRLTKKDLGRILELHALYADLTRRTPVIARARGSDLLAHLLASIEQAGDGRAVRGALGAPGDLALVVVGHDTNQSNVSGLLGLTWKVPGYPRDDVPPGGALIFSLWRDSTGSAFVRTQYVAQTPDQMRFAVRLTLVAPPAVQDVAVPGCGRIPGHPACDLVTFSRIVRAAVDPAFVR
ncbi:MAG TPA: histidine-type phosphatase [Vicinamibacterales bacterium]|nr:histidine-type phosphatase [Vicinamibacterales bacterium]